MPAKHPKVPRTRPEPAGSLQLAARDPGSLRPRDILALQRSAGNQAVCRLLEKAEPISLIQSQPVSADKMIVQRVPAPVASWVRKLVDRLNKEHAQKKERSRYFGKGWHDALLNPNGTAARSWLKQNRGRTYADLVTFIKEAVKSSSLVKDPDRVRIDTMDRQALWKFMKRTFTSWGCDALLRASLGELYKGKTAAGESAPMGETFVIAEALRTKSHWKSCLLDLTIRNASEKDRKSNEFAKYAKVGIDQVLTKEDVDNGALAQITSHEYYFGLTYGANHNFIGSREITFHGQWAVIPGQPRPMVTPERLMRCLKHYKRLLIVFP